MDSYFVPAAIFNRNYRQAVKDCPDRTTFKIALESNVGVTRRELEILPGHPDTFCYVERMIKFLLWSNGGHCLYLWGDQQLCQQLQQEYSSSGKRYFDIQLMKRVYGRDFLVVITDKMPEAKESSSELGGNLNGCRIGFDLGASDYKISAVKDGQEVFSEEIVWTPVEQTDPQYHITHIENGLKKAASYLPQVDAIGGSSAGIIVDGRVKIASLFRGIPEQLFFQQIEPIFFNIHKRWQVPVAVANDGDVTALAGALSLGKKGILGIAMGSSEASGFINREGNITGQLNELAFAPVDYSHHALCDEWSKDQGGGALYFSQQAVGRLVSHAGIKATGPLPQVLKEVQQLMEKDDPRARAIFETIGIYFGYTIAHYREFYDFDHLLILGRVTSGRGGEIIVEQAKRVLKEEFPELNAGIELHVPDEKFRRLGQAFAAASLPEVK